MTLCWMSMKDIIYVAFSSSRNRRKRENGEMEKSKGNCPPARRHRELRSYSLAAAICWTFPPAFVFVFVCVFVFAFVFVCVFVFAFVFVFVFVFVEVLFPGSCHMLNFFPRMPPAVCTTSARRLQRHVLFVFNIFLSSFFPCQICHDMCPCACFLFPIQKKGKRST